MPKNVELYFVALVPKGREQSSIMELKQWVFAQCGSKAALRSPAHITLHMPFNWPLGKENQLINSLQKLAQEEEPFVIDLQNFGCFEPRVLYVNVIENPKLTHLYSKIETLSKAQWKLDKPKNLRVFTPHITIGFRDLKKSDFYRLWEQLQMQTYHSSYNVDSLCLLKHTGKQWEVCSRFNFKN